MVHCSQQRQNEVNALANNTAGVDIEDLKQEQEQENQQGAKTAGTTNLDVGIKNKLSGRLGQRTNRGAIGK